MLLEVLPLPAATVFGGDPPAPPPKLVRLSAPLMPPTPAGQPVAALLLPTEELPVRLDIAEETEPFLPLLTPTLCGVATFEGGGGGGGVALPNFETLFFLVGVSFLSLSNRSSSPPSSRRLT